MSWRSRFAPSPPCSAGNRGHAGRRGPAAALLLGALLLPWLAGCGPLNGQTGDFVQQPSDNTDFQSPAYVTLGNLPSYMALYPAPPATPTYIAAVDNVALDPVNPDGSFNPSGSVTVVQNAVQSDYSLSLTTTATLTTQQFPTVAEWANLQGTGNPDLVVLDNLNLHVGVYLSTGPGTFNSTPSQEFTFPHTIEQMAVADLNGDGRDDVVLTAPGDDQIVALLNDGTGHLTEVKTSAGLDMSHFIVADLNGDGTPDLAIIQAANTLSVWKGQGDGTFAQTLPSTAIGLAPSAISMVGGNLTGNGHEDIAVLSDTGLKDSSAVYIYVNDGTGQFTPVGPFNAYQRPKHLYLLGTVAGTTQDLGVTHQNQRFISVMRSISGPAYDTEVLSTTRDPVGIASGDINGDGAVDLVTAENTRRVIGVFAGDGAGNFTRTQLGLLTEPTFPRLVDVNGDGKLDLLVLEPNSDRLAVYLNAH